MPQEHQPAGLRIASFVIRSFGTLPWRLGAEDYATVASAMRERGLAVPEEAVPATPLQDLPS